MKEDVTGTTVAGEVGVLETEVELPCVKVVANTEVPIEIVLSKFIVKVKSSASVFVACIK